MIRYLLDELYTYEQDHSHALCPTPNVSNQYSGGLQRVDENAAPLAALLSAAEFRELFSAQAERLESQLNNLQQGYSCLASKIVETRGVSDFGMGRLGMVRYHTVNGYYMHSKSLTSLSLANTLPGTNKLAEIG